MCKKYEISIHVPREGDDVPVGCSCCLLKTISIHVPREGDDGKTIFNEVHAYQFLSTSPARGTTPASGMLPRSPANFYPRPPRGGRLYSFRISSGKRSFLSTSPARGTTLIFLVLAAVRLFLSTSPARGTTDSCYMMVSHHQISIHVPREGDDDVVQAADGGNYNFYPRPPRGGRLSRIVTRGGDFYISIHVPREGDD